MGECVLETGRDVDSGLVGSERTLMVKGEREWIKEGVRRCKSRGSGYH